MGRGIWVGLTENLRLSRLEGNERVSRWVFEEVSGGQQRKQRPEITGLVSQGDLEASVPGAE